MIVCFNDEVRFKKNVYKVIYFFVVTMLKYKADVFFKNSVHPNPNPLC